MRIIASTLCAVALMTVVPAGFAADASPVVARNSKGMTITASDLLEEGKRFSGDTVKDALGRPENARQIALNLLLRRALAADAEKQQLDQQPDVIARLRLARERVLSDARVQQFDGAAPDLATLEKRARSEYNANPERFRITAADRLEHLLVGRYRKDGAQMAGDLATQLKNGAPFGTLAIMYSDDAGTKANRGDMGFMEKGRLRPELEKAAASLAKPGDVSDVIETEIGWHIVRLAERRAAGKKSFEDVKEELMQAAARDVVDKRRAVQLEPYQKDIQFEEDAIESVVRRFR